MLVSSCRSCIILSELLALSICLLLFWNFCNHLDEIEVDPFLNLSAREDLWLNVTVKTSQPHVWNIDQWLLNTIMLVTSNQSYNHHKFIGKTLWSLESGIHFTEITVGFIYFLTNAATMQVTYQEGWIILFPRTRPISSNLWDTT